MSGKFSNGDYAVVIDPDDENHGREGPVLQNDDDRYAEVFFEEHTKVYHDRQLGYADVDSVDEDFYKELPKVPRKLADGVPEDYKYEEE